MIFDILTPPQCPRGRGKKNDVACPIHVSNSYVKFGSILLNGLGGDSITDRRTDRRTGGRTEAITISHRLFKKSVGIMTSFSVTCNK